MKYQSRRHRWLMDESEHALWSSVEAESGRDSRIAHDIVKDPANYLLWESRHAELVRPVAEENRRTGQVIALRSAEVSLIHRRALVHHLRGNKINGQERAKLMSVFYGPKETNDAIIAEHRQYMMAVSSRVSAHHLIDIMKDPVSLRLLRLYEDLYTEYFDLFCFASCEEDSACSDAARLLMKDARRLAKDARHRIDTVLPDKKFASFDREAMLARSGRYPIVDYMVG